MSDVNLDIFEDVERLPAEYMVGPYWLSPRMGFVAMVKDHAMDLWVTTNGGVSWDFKLALSDDGDGEGGQ